MVLILFWVRTQIWVLWTSHDPSFKRRSKTYKQNLTLTKFIINLQKKHQRKIIVQFFYWFHPNFKNLQAILKWEAKVKKVIVLSSYQFHLCFIICLVSLKKTSTVCFMRKSDKKKMSQFERFISVFCNQFFLPSTVHTLETTMIWVSELLVQIQQ